MNKAMILLLPLAVFGAEVSQAVVKPAQNDAQLSGVEKKLKAIQGQRQLNANVLVGIKDPFYYENLNAKAQTKQATQEAAPTNTTAPTRLKAIVGNMAKIDDAWFKKNDKVGSQVITAITNDRILLEDESGNIEVKKLQKENTNALQIK